MSKEPDIIDEYEEEGWKVTVYSTGHKRYSFFDTTYVHNKRGSFCCPWGPAREYEAHEGYRREWLLNGEKHRVDGPAVEILRRGKVWAREFWVNGKPPNDLQKTRMIVEEELRRQSSRKSIYTT